MNRKFVLLPLALGGFAVIGGVLFALFQSPTFTISRSLKMKAPLALVFEQVSNLHQWKNWSPWQKGDPTMKTEIVGAIPGVGSKQIWSGEKSGNGELTFTEFVPNQKIGYHILFKDWNSESNGEFLFTPTPEGVVTLTWTMHGKNRFSERLLWLIFRFQKSIEKDFDTGLMNIKLLVEKS